jgi:hypothetical protein
MSHFVVALKLMSFEEARQTISITSFLRLQIVFITSIILVHYFKTITLTFFRTTGLKTVEMGQPKLRLIKDAVANGSAKETVDLKNGYSNTLGRFYFYTY